MLRTSDDKMLGCLALCCYALWLTYLAVLSSLCLNGVAGVSYYWILQCPYVTVIRGDQNPPVKPSDKWTYFTRTTYRIWTQHLWIPMPMAQQLRYDHAPDVVVLHYLLFCGTIFSDLIYFSVLWKCIVISRYVEIDTRQKKIVIVIWMTTRKSNKKMYRSFNFGCCGCRAAKVDTDIRPYSYNNAIPCSCLTKEQFNK